jgi:hypothetical protein
MFRGTNNGEAFNPKLAAALRTLEQGEADLRDATAKLARQLDQHARHALETGLIKAGSELLAHRR